jgi:hypothetical protein
MEELYEDVRTEIKHIEHQGISRNNIDTLGKLVDIVKDIEMIWYYQKETKK